MSLFLRPPSRKADNIAFPLKVVGNL